MDKVSTQESKRVLKNSESTYSTSFNMQGMIKEIFMLLFKKNTRNTTSYPDVVHVKMG